MLKFKTVNLKYFVLLFSLIVLIICLVGCNGKDDEITVAQEFTLSIEIEGEGSIEPEAGIYTFSEDTTVTIKVFPEEGWLFSHWSGASAQDVISNGNENSYRIMMDGNKNIKAVFSEMQVEGDDYSISGYVYSTNDEPLSGIEIVFTRGFSSVETNQQGYWERRGLSGAIEVSAICPNHSFAPGLIKVNQSQDNINFVGIELEEWQHDIILHENVKFFTKSEANNIDDVSKNRNEIFLRENTIFSEQLKVGDVLSIDQPLPNAEYGLLKKIIGISNDGRRLQVEPANLADVIAEGEISIGREITFDDIVQSFEKSDEINILSIDKEARILFFEKDFDINIFGDKGKIYGHIKFNYDTDFNLDLKYTWGIPRGIEAISMVFETGIDSAIDIEIEVDYDWEYKPEPISILKADLVAPPGIPVFAGVNLIPRLTLLIGAEADLSADFSAGVEFNRGFEIGLRKTKDDSWNNIGVMNLTGDGLSTKEPNINGRASAKFYSGLEIDMVASISYLLEGGLGAGVYGNLDAVAEAQSLPEWSWHYDLDFNIDGQLSVCFGALRLFSFKHEIGRTGLYSTNLAYGVSGQILDKNNKGIENTTVQFNRGFNSVETDADGIWQKHLLNGEVVITPNNKDYSFTPESRTVSRSTSGLDFKGARIDSYNVNLNSPTKVTGAGTYRIGQMVTIETESSYRMGDWGIMVFFKNWTDDDNYDFEVSRERKYSFTMPSRDINYTANYGMLILDPKVFSVNLNVNDDNFGTVKGAGFYNAGDTVTIEATPSNSSFIEFISWTDDDNNNVVVSRDRKFTFKMPSKNINYTANFVIRLG